MFGNVLYGRQARNNTFTYKIRTAPSEVREKWEKLKGKTSERSTKDKEDFKDWADRI